MDDFNIVDASIDELQAALSAGLLTSVDLVALYLRRISKYDCRNTTLNSIPILNDHAFDQAAASDDLRATGAQSTRPLEGIPYTVKDSYKVRDMTIACGSPAFEHLVATDDAFAVSAIQNAGGVLLGRTNMPPMAYGGMQRGIYGRAESPYNPEYLAAAFWSGSSNGSGVATSCSFGAFGMGEETVSSGRAPASNNALAAYTPSRGWLSIRGNWPLYMTCDVIVPHTRTMDDMLTLLEVIAADDPVSKGDFWRDQPFVKLQDPWGGQSKAPGFFRNLGSCKTLSGLRIAVPAMYIGGPAPAGATPVTTCPEVVELWLQAKSDLESLGAEVIVVSDFPAVTAYENPDLLPADCPRRPDNWHFRERGPLIAHGWNEFLRQNGDPQIPDLRAVDLLNIYPESMRTLAEEKVREQANAIHFPELTDYLQGSSLYDVPDLQSALEGLEGMRKHLLEDWMTQHGLDCVVFPSAGDVGPANADIDDDGAVNAKRNGVFYSNGNRALRHLGIPSVSVPMGLMSQKCMPVNLTFVSRAYDDVNLLRWGNAFEKKTRRRMVPPRTPALDSVSVSRIPDIIERAARPRLTIETCEAHSVATGTNGELQVSLEGTILIPHDLEGRASPEIEITVDAATVPTAQITMERADRAGNCYRFKSSTRTPRPPQKDPRSRTLAPTASDKTMVVVLARSRPGGRPSGCLRLL